MSRWLASRGLDVRGLLTVEEPERIRFFDRSTLLLFAVTFVWYLTLYFTNASVPSSDPHGPVGWWGWWDQGQYYKCIVDVAHGRLVPENYWFGYPILGVPFYWLMPRHPLLIPDLTLVLVMIGSFYVACRYHLARIEAWGLVILFFFIEPFMRGSLVVPSNTLPAYATIYLSAYLLLFRRPSLGHFLLCAVFIGVTLFSRPTEIFPLACIYLAGVWRLETGRVAALTYLIITFLIVFGLTLGLNFHLYGQWSTPYMALEGRKFHFENYGLKIYQLFSDGRFLTGNGALPDMDSLSLAERYPIFLFCLPGMIYLVKSGAQMWGLILAMASSLAFYLTYSTYANMPFFWTYSSFHYIWWMMPWVAFFTYLSLRRARQQMSPKLFATALVIPPLLFLLIGFKAVSVPLTEPTTSYNNRTCTIDLVAPATIDALGIRLKFQTPPSYGGLGSSVVSDQKVKVWVNGNLQLTMPDYFMSEDGSTFDFSFLIHGLVLKQGDKIEIQFSETDPPALIDASLIDYRFKLGRFSE